MIDYSTDSLVSVVIPFYNNETTIKDTLYSLESQEHKNIEIILVEDLKSNPIPKEINSQNFNLNIFSFKNRKGAGASSNRNLGLSKAKGFYIQFLDADDLLSYDKISSQVKLLDGNKSEICICKWATFENEIGDNKMINSQLYQNWSIREYLALLNGTFSELMPIHGYLIPKYLIDKTSGWNESITLGDDGEFMNRVVLKAESIIFSDIGLAYYRRGNTKSLSNRIDEKSTISNLQCSIFYEDLVKKYFYSDKYMTDSVIRKYNLLFFWSFIKYPEIAREAENRIKILGGKLNMRVGSKFSKFLQRLLGIKIFLKLKYLLSK